MFYDDQQLSSEENLQNMANEFEKKLSPTRDNFLVPPTSNEETTDNNTDEDKLVFNNLNEFLQNNFDEQFYDENGNLVTITQQLQKLYTLLLTSENNFFTLKSYFDNNKNQTHKFSQKNNLILEEIKMQKQILQQVIYSTGKTTCKSLSINSNNKNNKVNILNCMNCETDIVRLILWFLILQNAQKPRPHTSRKHSNTHTANTTLEKQMTATHEFYKKVIQKQLYINLGSTANKTSENKTENPIKTLSKDINFTILFNEIANTHLSAIDYLKILI